MDQAIKAAAARTAMQRTRYGFTDGAEPSHEWLGSMRSRSAERIPPEFLAAGSELLYVPKRRAFRRRLGQTQKFDTFGAAVGMLPAKWGGKSRQMEEFTSDSITDNTPTVCSLVTKETNASGSVLDDGKFSNFWLRDQVNGINYTVGSDFDTTNTYPAPGSTQSYRVVPLWYESGDGGLTRGTTEYARRFFFSGSRHFQKVGKKTYFPSRLGTPSRWAGTGVQATEGSELFATSDATGSPTSLSCTTNGTTTLTSAAQFGALTAGMVISGTGIPEGTRISSIATSSSLTMSRAATDSTTNSRGFALSTFWLQSISGGNGQWTIANLQGSLYQNAYQDLATTNPNEDDDMVAINNASAGAFPFNSTLNFATLSSSVTQWRIRARCKLTVAYVGVAEFHMTMTDSAGTKYTTSSQDLASMSVVGSYTDLIFDVGPGNISGTGTANQVTLVMTRTSGTFSQAFRVTRLSVAPLSGSSATDSNRLIPSGPLPPIHAGTIVKGNAIAGSSGSSYIYPDGDITVGSWTTLTGPGTLYTQIDDHVGALNTSDGIHLTGVNSTSEVSLENFSFVPAVTDNVYVRWNWSGFGDARLTVSLVEGATVRSTVTVNVSAHGPQWDVLTLSATEIGSVSDWFNVRIRFDTANMSGLDTITIFDAYVQHTAGGLTSEGAWHGKDRFAYSLAYRFEDGSVHMPVIPRLPSTTLPNGYCIFTVDSANPDTAYDKITFQNLPVPPEGYPSKLIFRGPKTDATTDDPMAIDVFDLRFVAEVAASVTTYDSYAADDDSLELDVDELVLRWDHMMPPRARYAFGGDSRVCHSYGATNPCAIILAPVGRTADYDLNLADNSSTAYTQNSSYVYITATDGTNGSLALKKSDGTSVTTKTISFSATTTLQDVVDSINATSCAVDSLQWRAQLLPDVDPAALAATVLLPHSQTVASCTVTGQAITVASNLLGKIGVGSYIKRSGTDTGAYVTSIDSSSSSASQVTFTGTVSAGSGLTMTFYFRLGDAPVTASGDTTGDQRVIASSLPGFLYFRKTYLDTQVNDKTAIWMTVGDPLSGKAAANCFSTKSSNVFRPPVDAGIQMGGRACDTGFITPYSKKRVIIAREANTGQGVGRDSDYHLTVTNEASGCIAWQSLTAGTGCAVMMAPEGLVVQDLRGEYLLSEAIYDDRPNNLTSAVTSIGDFGYEAAASIAATALDNDGAYMVCRIMRSTLFVNYRNSSGSTRPDRQVRYDFSAGLDAYGRAALVRSPGVPWGWSLPLTMAFTAMTEGRRSDGPHLYGWNDANAGSTGDGRIDEFETADTDNGTAISGSGSIPWLAAGHDLISAQEFIVDHQVPTGATVTMTFTRSYSVDQYSFTGFTGSSTPVVLSNLKMLTQAARVASAACYLTWSQTGGAASELRGLELRWKRVPRYT